MRALVYTHSHEPEFLRHDSLAIRLATILGSDILVVGDPAFHMHHKRLLEGKRNNIKMMLTLMHNASQSEKQRAELAEWYEIYKRLRSKGHLDKQGIVTLQKVTRATADLFQHYIDDTYQLTQRVIGLPSLEVLINEGFTGFYNSDLKIGRLGSDKHDLADMFRYNLSTEREPFVPMIGGSRLESVRENSAHHIHIMSQSTVMLLEGNNLLAMRKDLTHNGQRFCSAMDDLFGLCLQHPGTERPEQAVNVLEQQVAPALRNAMEEFDTHPIQQSLRVRESGLSTLHIGVGLCPYRTYIEAYREAEMIDDRTWQILNSTPPHHLPMPGWVPYIATHLERPDQGTEQEHAPLRTLEID